MAPEAESLSACTNIRSARPLPIHSSLQKHRGSAQGPRAHPVPPPQSATCVRRTPADRYFSVYIPPRTGAAIRGRCDSGECDMQRCPSSSPALLLD